MSYPDNIMVMRLTSDSKKGKISRMISLESLHTDKVIRASDNTITRQDIHSSNDLLRACHHSSE